MRTDFLRWRHRAGPMALALGLLGPLVSPSPAAAYCRLSTGNPRPGSGDVCIEIGELLHWRRACIGHTVHERPPMRLTLEESRMLVARAFETWLTVECDGQPLPFDLGQTPEVATCDEGTHNAGGRNVDTIVVYPDWEAREFPPSAFGFTLVWHNKDTGEIYGADMLLNDETMGALSDCPDRGCPPGQVDLRSVVTHEAGHFLGLSHSDSPASAMYWTANPRETSKRQLNADDRAGLCSLYGQEGGAPACGEGDFTPARGLDRNCVAGGSGTGARSACACRVPGGVTHRPAGGTGGRRFIGGGLAGALALLGATWRRRTRRRGAS